MKIWERHALHQHYASQRQHYPLTRFLVITIAIVWILVWLVSQ